MAKKIETAADKAVRECLDKQQSFALIAGAGSGKTSSLVEALQQIREQEGQRLRQNGQQVACIAFTKRAVEVIKGRLDFDDLFAVTTLHSFLWNQIGRFKSDIREALRERRLPELIAKEREKDNGGASRTAQEARAKASRLEQELVALEAVTDFEYTDANFGDYPNGKLGHDDIISIAGYLFEINATFRRIIGLRFPYIFVDEAQDTFEVIIAGLNLVGADQGFPVIGYFGDPWQQIYDRSAGDFTPPANGKIITKTENFRCSESVIRLLNAFRQDVKQYAAGKNKNREGSVLFRIVKAEAPEGPRNTYTEEQIARALTQMDTAINQWGWSDRNDVIKLFLVRQMIARRMGFSNLNRLFNGQYASSRAEDQFEAGEHPLLLPITTTILPLIKAQKANNSRQMIDILRRDSPAFAVDGINAGNTLKVMIDTSVALVDQLVSLWNAATVGEVLRFCVDKQIIHPSNRLCDHLGRPARTEEYDETLHSIDKGDWLADAFFNMSTIELCPYATFIANNTAYSTQHGVKGEEYSKVMVVYDDIEANWSNYNFGKILTPETSGKPTDGQLSRGSKLIYVSFSRALEDLRVLFFSKNPTAARQELINKKLLEPDQIEVIE